MTCKKLITICLAAGMILGGAAPAFCAVGEPDDEQLIIRLQRENYLLRMKLDSLEKALGRAGRDFATFGSVGLSSSFRFFSVVDSWDSLTGEDDVYLTFEDKVEEKSPFADVNTLLRIPEDDVLWKYVDIYSVQRKRGMALGLSRYDHYLEMFRKAFRKYGVPEELTLLSIVESACNTRAKSKAGAVGLWQFMPETARSYGLTVDGAVDDRYDPVKATDAAARYLRDLEKSLGTWSLALMSYNCGKGRLQKALAACGDNLSYEELYRHLPTETREYLPALVAAMYVNQNRALLHE